MQLGYEGVEDRYTSNTQFCHRIHQEGKDMSNCQFDGMFACGHLPGAPRTRAQFVAGVAANAENEHVLTKLLFVSSPKGNYGYPDDFKKAWTKPWGFIFGRRVFTQKGYDENLEKDGSNRMLLTWRGVVKVPEENVTDFLEKQYVENYEAVMTNIEKKQKQSQVAKKRNAEEESGAAGSSSPQADASSSSPAASPVPEPKTPPKSASAARSGQPDAPRGGQSWSWSRDHYGSRREGSHYQGNWWYRDDRRSRWIFWGR